MHFTLMLEPTMKPIEQSKSAKLYKYLSTNIDLFEAKLNDGHHFEHDGQTWNLYDPEGNAVHGARTLRGLINISSGKAILEEI